MLVLYGFLLSQTFILNYFLFINQNAKDVMQFVNLPFIKKKKLTEEQTQMIRKNMVKMMAMINLFMSIMFSWILIGTVQTALGEASGLSSGLMIYVIIIIIVPFYFIWKSYRIAKGES